MLCTVNGQVRQHGNTRDMLFPVATILAFLSTRWRLLPGDLIYTGTPAGVGPLKPGDRIEISSPSPRHLLLDLRVNPEEARRLAEAVRAACLKAAQEGYEQAAASGLCHEGAVEASLGAVEHAGSRRPCWRRWKHGKKPR